MRIYIVKYCLREDARNILTTDQFYTNFNDAVNASLELEEDSDVYTSWVEEDFKEYIEKRKHDTPIRDNY